MKKTLIYSMLFLSALSFSPFAFSETQKNMPAQEQKMKSDGEVIAWISAIDNFEIKASEVALTKNVDSPVKNYATMLNDQHSKNLKQTAELSDQLHEKPVDTKALTKFKENGKKQLTKLDKQDKNFQKSFIDAMVSGHQDALHKVDTDLMKKVSNDSLASLLKETREMIANHLEQAKEIQKSMKSSS